jgi:hypothetical protein
MPLPRRPHDRRRFALPAFAIAASVVYFAPVPGQQGGRAVLRALFTKAELVVVGNSIIDHVSRCDVDRRSIAEEVSVATGRTVSDISYGGQSIEESANVAAVALRNPDVGAIVVGIAPGALQAWGELPVQDQLFYRLVNRPLVAAPPWSKLGAGVISEYQKPFAYKGVQYPDYAGIKKIFYEAESKAMGCPETDGRDRTFVEANYFHNYLTYPVRDDNVVLLGSLSRYASRRDKDVVVIILPVDYQALGGFDRAWPDELRQGTRGAVSALRTAGVAVVDLSEAASNDMFADRWCACGHLLETGRAVVADAVADAVRRLPVASR